jgi:hypothetical protein
VGVLDKLRCTGRAAGVEVSCNLITGNVPTADKPIGRLRLNEIAERIDFVLTPAECFDNARRGLLLNARLGTPKRLRSTEGALPLASLRRADATRRR